MSVVYSQNFDELNDGDLHGQDGWADSAGSATFAVQTTTKYAGAKALQETNNNINSVIWKLLATHLATGNATFYLRSATTNKNVGGGCLYTNVHGFFCNIYMRSDGYISYYIGGNYEHLVAYSVNIWYKVQVEWKDNNQIRFKVDDDGDWTEWLTSTTFTKVGAFGFSGNNLDGGFFADELVISDTISAPATNASFLLSMV